MSEMIQLKLSQISPSQPDDGLYSNTIEPINVFQHDDRWVIKEGNHRYYRDLEEKGPDAEVDVIVTSNPYIDY